MAQNARIEELRKRLEREPGSPLFAQYAEELRRAGQLEEAIRVCREGVAKHANYPTGRITLARALADSGDAAAARSEFEAVLRAAPDNVIAKRGLEELAGAQGVQQQGAPAAPATGAAPPDSRTAAGEPAPIRERETPARKEATGQAGAGTGPEGAEDEAPRTRAPAATGATAAASSSEDEEYELETLRPAAAPGPPQLTFRPLVDEDERAAAATPTRRIAAAAVPAPTVKTPPVKAEPARAGRAPEAKTGGADLASPTLAELYLEQGDVQRAVAMYEELVAREPMNARFTVRLQELRSRVAAAEAQAEGARTRAPRLRRALARLDALRAAFRTGAGRARA